MWSPISSSPAGQCTLRVVSQPSACSYTNVQPCPTRTAAVKNRCRVPPLLTASMNFLRACTRHTANILMQTQRTLFQLLIGEGHSLWKGRYSRFHTTCSLGRELSTMIDQRTQNQGQAGPSKAHPQRPMSTSQAPPPKGSTGPPPALSWGT